jgi:dihydroorotase
MIELFTSGPAGVLKLDRGTLATGSAGDVTILDPALAWTYNVNKSESKSRNSPFHGRAFRGAAIATIVGGRIVHQFNP